MPERRVAVVGGGITGLATAWYLRKALPDLAVTVYESEERLGGKIHTGEWIGVPVETGPDTFLARVPWAVNLCREVGLGDDLVAPATGKAYVWTRARLRALPEGQVLGVPSRLGPLARSGIVSPAGLARAGLDLVLPRDRRGASGDPSVAEVVGARFGREVIDRLVDPLLGGIHAGSTSRLSLAAVAPQIAAVATRHRSLLIGLRTATPASGSGPVFLAVRGGLSRLVERLRERLEGVEFRARAPVASLADVGAGVVVLTVPAFAAAPLVHSLAPAAARELEAIDYASVTTATLAYPQAARSRTLDGSGFLVPAVDGRLITACTWLTSKWPHLGASGRILVRASAGRTGDDRALHLDDGAFVDRVHDELAEAMGLRREPEAWTVTRWPRAFPQYVVGHKARVERIEAALAAEAPHVLLAGAGYRGLGVAACVQQAEQAAARAVALLRAAEPGSQS